MLLLRLYPLKLRDDGAFLFGGLDRKNVISDVGWYFFGENELFFFDEGIGVDHSIILTFHFFEFNVRLGSTPAFDNFGMDCFFSTTDFR